MEYNCILNALEIAFVALVAVVLHSLIRPAKCRVIIWGIVGIRALLPSYLSKRLHIFDISLYSLKTSADGYRTIDSNRLITVWIAGMVMFVFMVGVEYVRLWKITRCSCEQTKGIFVTDGIPTAFTMGCFNPRIYIPSDADNASVSFLMDHEKVHVAKRDFLQKQIALAVLCVNWYNPAMWLAYFAFSSDQEIACDEAVVAEYDVEKRAEYLKTLVLFSSRKKSVSLQFGTCNVKTRIKSVMSFRNRNKRDYILTATVVLVVASLLSVGLIAKNKQEQSYSSIPGTDSESDVDFFISSYGDADYSELQIEYK